MGQRYKAGDKRSQKCYFFVHALLPAGSLDGCASLFVGVRDNVAVYSGGSVGDGICEGDV